MFEFLMCLLSVIGCIGLIPLTLFLRFNKKDKKIEEEKTENKFTKIYKPHFLKSLSQEEVDDIHSRGKITPLEKVQEWESMDLCAPGDHASSAAWRCKIFKTCHACLEDYAATLSDEYTSFFDIIASLPEEDLNKIDFRLEKLDS